METLSAQLQSSLPEGWKLTHLILLDPEWQCNITDDEYVAIGTGESLESAITSAAQKALDGQTVGRLLSLGRLRTAEPSDLFSALGFKRPAPTVVTRRI